MKDRSKFGGLDSLYSALFRMNRLMIFVMLLVGIVAFIFVYDRGQDLNYDLLNYHYYTGYALLHGRYEQDIAAAGFQSFLHPATNVMAYISLRHLPFPFSAWSILLVQLASVPAVALIAWEVGKGLGYRQVSLAQVLAFLLCLLSPLWWSELGTTFFSSWIAPAILWGTYFLVRCLSVPSVSFGGILVAGALLGFATGLKLTNAPFVVAAFTVLLFLSRDSDFRALVHRTLFFMLGGIFGFALTAWWYGYLWTEWKNPLFPLYNAVFASPYYDLKNYRDFRWKFFSLWEFFSYIGQTAVGTVKTSEIRFVDARFLAISVLAAIALLRKPVVRLGKQGEAVLIFFLVSFLLWAVLFAYQRYLIPVEVLLGLVAWILLARIFKREWPRVVVLMCLVVLSAGTIKIPDWGHGPVDIGARKPFSLRLPEHLANTPARYLVVGAPVSYLLPYLHAESIFYGLNFSKQSKALIAERLREPSPLPVRVLLEDRNLPTVWKHLGYLGFARDSNSLVCTDLSTVVADYSVCEIVLGKRLVSPDGVVVSTGFSEAEYSQRKGVLWARGLSHQEYWGRWSDGDSVEIGLVNCLPQGVVRVAVTAQAFGPNVGKPIRFTLGEQDGFASFSQSIDKVFISFVNQNKCTDKLTIYIPEATTPAELKLSSDARKLGIGLVRVEIIKE